MHRIAAHIIQGGAAAGTALVVLESYFHRVVNSRDHTDVVLAAGIALEEIQALNGQGTGKSEDGLLKPI